jgi:hypothetical protein
MVFNLQVTQNGYYQLYATTISFFAPTAIMFTLYFKIWQAAKRLSRLDRVASNSIVSWNGDSVHLAAPVLTKNNHDRLPRSLFHAVRMPLVGRLQHLTKQRNDRARDGKAMKTLGVSVEHRLCIKQQTTCR